MAERQGFRHVRMFVVLWSHHQPGGPTLTFATSFACSSFLAMGGREESTHACVGQTPDGSRWMGHERCRDRTLCAMRSRGYSCEQLVSTPAGSQADGARLQAPPSPMDLAASSRQGHLLASHTVFLGSCLGLVAGCLHRSTAQFLLKFLLPTELTPPAHGGPVALHKRQGVGRQHGVQPICAGSRSTAKGHGV